MEIHNLNDPDSGNSYAPKLAQPFCLCGRRIHSIPVSHLFPFSFLSSFHPYTKKVCGRVLSPYLPYSFISLLLDALQLIQF